MIDRFAQFPRSLAEKTRSLRVGDIPVLLAHPDWATPAPTTIWLHGRTASKELDPGRYLRWIRGGIAACAIDLPGHGERLDPAMQEPSRTLDVLAQAVGEIDRVVEFLADPSLGGVFDLDRLALGGMSAGGMVTLRRLCDPHPFRGACVEATCGWLGALYEPSLIGASASHRWSHRHAPDKIKPVDPAEHLESFSPIPVLAAHSRTDAVIPWETQRRFLDRLADRYERAGASRELIQILTWPETGAPEEHVGFGRFSNDAKNAQTAFLSGLLGLPPRAEDTP
jgi:alpha-beta hydrolase superfamily lysophospholipase